MLLLEMHREKYRRLRRSFRLRGVIPNPVVSY